MNTQGHDNPDPRPRIELQPLDQRPPPPRYVEKTDEKPEGQQGDYGLPVPAEPLHVCPTCDYNLTGLLSRRCPECGTIFTLWEARHHGARLTPRGKQDVKFLLHDRISFYVGLGLFIAGGIIQNFTVGQGIGRFGFIHFSIVCELLLILLGSCVLKIYYQLSWTVAMVIAGLTTATITSFFLLT